MTGFLTRLLGRMPIGWLQLAHNRTRLAAALAGIVFANVLVFIQLGIMGALNTTIVLPYKTFDADIIVSAADTTTLADGSNVPRARGYEALSMPGVSGIAFLYIGNVDWTRPDGKTANLQVIALDPGKPGFAAPDLRPTLANLRLADTVLIDTDIRGVEREALAGITPDAPLRFEVRGRTLTALGTFTIGGGFSADGYLYASDQTFLRLFDNRSSGAPNHILVKARPGVAIADLVQQLRTVLPADKVLVRSVADAARADQIYQTTERPTGLIFGFGVVMGVIVGLVIVYQLLSTDVADHLREYATFKAMGYPQSFFLGIVFEEAIILAVLGFIPGCLISLGLYQFLNAMTGLPVAMDLARPAAVFLGTVASCTLSGAVATRRLANADPADLF